MDKTRKARNIIWQNTYSLGVGCVFALAFGIFSNGYHAVSMFVKYNFVQSAVHSKGFLNNIFIRMRRKTSPFTAEISGEDCEAVLKTFNFSQAYFAAQYIVE